MSLLTTEEMAAELRIRPTTLKDWVKREIVPAIRITPKVLRFDPAAVYTSLATRQSATNTNNRQTTDQTEVASGK
ncbi:MAG: helix-turn-helix domain-containing protein [Phycisphaerae bacterium]|nr:helix-turn-helix domain-containing protein [Phycisphaerae bacterium]